MAENQNPPRVQGQAQAQGASTAQSAQADSGDALVRIQSEDGTKQYSVTEDAYHSTAMASLDGQTYEEAGYTIVSYEDGTPYGTDAEPTKWAKNKNAGAPAIGADATSVTNIDGEPATEDQIAAAGLSAQPTQPTPATQPAPPPTAAVQPTAPALTPQPAPQPVVTPPTPPTTAT